MTLLLPIAVCAMHAVGHRLLAYAFSQVLWVFEWFVRIVSFVRVLNLFVFL